MEGRIEILLLQGDHCCKIEVTAEFIELFVEFWVVDSIDILLDVSHLFHNVDVLMVFTLYENSKYLML
jgi:hypothetical protein